MSALQCAVLVSETVSKGEKSKMSGLLHLSSEDVNRKKKKNVSRNKKIYWRKHADVKDVEDFLSEKRSNERVGYVYFFFFLLHKKK